MSEFKEIQQPFNSKPVDSNQTGIHENLRKNLVRYQTRPFNKKSSTHTKMAFEQVCKKIDCLKRPLILDSGCGTGQSSLLLAEKYEDHLIVALDKSEHRLAKNKKLFAEKDNLIMVRADQFDFWFLAEQANLVFQKHYILYPNPWPKKSQVKRRFYAHPQFASACAISQAMIVRSNWHLLLEEFQLVIHFYLDKSVNIRKIVPEKFLTLFERKYAASGQPLYEATFSKL